MAANDQKVELDAVTDVASQLGQTCLVSNTPQGSRLSVGNVTTHDENDKIYQNAKEYLGSFPYASGLPLDVQAIMSRFLNPEVEISMNDYRGLATKLGFDVYFINNLKSKKNPTEVLLQNCTDKTSVHVAEILVEMKRTDVLRAIAEYGKKHGASGNKHHYLPRLQRSVEESGDSSSVADSGLPSDDCSVSWPGTGRSVAEFCQAMEDEFGKEQNDFFSKESDTFWENIHAGNGKRKPWTEFENALREACPKELQKGQVVKFVCHMLMIEYGKRSESTVLPDYFRKMVASFGPLKPGQDGCLQKMKDLMSKSLSHGKSWFVGHMTLEAAEKALCDEDPGKFLVRFSQSIDGFSLAAKTSRQGVRHYQIQVVDKQAQKLEFGNLKFNNLMELVEYGRDNPLDSNTNELLSSPPDELPLNMMFKGYDKVGGGVQGATHAAHRGRGRGRGRPPRR